MNWLKNPYPFIFEDRSVRLKLTFFIFMFVFSFLYIFKPFDFENVINVGVFLGSAIYGVSAAAVAFIVVKSIIVFTPKYASEKKWNIGRELFLLNLILICISLMNFYLAYGLEVQKPTGASFFNYFKQDVLHTYAIGFFPVLIVTFLNYTIRLKKNLNASERLNVQLESSQNSTESTIPKQIIIKSATKNNDLEIDIEELKFIMADGNYVEFHLEKKGEHIREIRRNTLNNITEQIDSFNFLFRSHRAYVVNLKYIVESSGNAQGYQLKMKDTQHIVPVSRTKLDFFNDLMETT